VKNSVKDPMPATRPTNPKFKECLGRVTVGTVTRMIYNFIHKMKPGDIVVANWGYNRVYWNWNCTRRLHTPI